MEDPGVTPKQGDIAACMFFHTLVSDTRRFDDHNAAVLCLPFSLISSPLMQCLFHVTGLRINSPHHTVLYHVFFFVLYGTVPLCFSYRFRSWSQY